MRLNQAQDKMMPPKRVSKQEMYDAAAGIAQHTVLQETFFISRKNTI